MLTWPAKTGTPFFSPTSALEVNGVDFGCSSAATFPSEVSFAEATVPALLSSDGAMSVELSSDLATSAEEASGPPKLTSPCITERRPEEVTLNSVPLTEAVATAERTLKPTFLPSEEETFALSEPESI